MCGINGILNFDGAYVNRDDLENMNNQMIFRGPDNDGFFQNKNFFNITKIFK